MQTNKFILFNPKLNVHNILLHKVSKAGCQGASHDYKSCIFCKLIQHFQVTLPADLLCYDLLNLFCNRGDGRFVLDKNKISTHTQNSLLSNTN